MTWALLFSFSGAIIVAVGALVLVLMVERARKQEDRQPTNPASPKE